MPRLRWRLLLDLDFLPQIGVERGERFVEQQHLRPQHQGAGQGHPLALAAAQLVGTALLVSRQAHEGQRFGHPGHVPGTRRRLVAQPEAHVLLDRQVRDSA